MTGDPAIDAALDSLVASTTAAEAWDWMWTARDRGADWQECREAYERYERKWAR